MKYFVVNRNNLDVIDEIDSETETAMGVSDSDGIKYTRFGPTIFLFEKRGGAVKLAESLLDEEIGSLETKLNRVREKKIKLKG